MRQCVFIQFRTMGFFNFSNKSTASNDGNSDQPVKRPVVIQLNDESITIPASEAEGKTVSQLFDENGDDLGDVNRINRYVAAGRIVDAGALVELGTIYRGATTSEAKG